MLSPEFLELYKPCKPKPTTWNSDYEDIWFYVTASHPLTEHEIIWDLNGYLEVVVCAI